MLIEFFLDSIFEPIYFLELGPIHKIQQFHLTTFYFWAKTQRGCREVVRYECFVGIIPVFSIFSNFFKKKEK